MGVSQPAQMESEDSEPSLWRRCAAGDRRARDELVLSHQPLARRLASRFVRSDRLREDLEQVASIGLIKAVDRFDASRGIPFHAYAVPTILGELRRWLRGSSWDLHVPRGDQERVMALRRAADEMAVELRRAPTIDELAAELGTSREEVVETYQARDALMAVSLDHPANGPDGEAVAMGELLGEEDPRIDRATDRIAAGRAIGALSARERRVLALRFGRDMTQSEIGRELGLSQMQISRILRTALERASTLARHGAGER
jgi:RNA polymerase sigma-B factor